MQVNNKYTVQDVDYLWGNFMGKAEELNTGGVHL